MVARQGRGSVFACVEGVLTNAVRKGERVLLYEVNMALCEALESLSSLLEIEIAASVCTRRGSTLLCSGTQTCNCLHA